MDPNRFFVSVIIPVYNGEAFLAGAIESIQQQNYQPLEIIIVDDGSTDATAAIAQGLKDASIRYFYQSNQGPSAARNKGLQMARGDVIGFLDADDLWTEGSLKYQLQCLEKDVSIEVVNGLTQFKWTQDVLHNDRRVNEPVVAFNISSAVFRKSVFDKMGVFDESMRFSEDVNFFLRLWEKGIKTVILEKTTLVYRKHPQGVSYAKDIHDSNFMKEIKRSLDRRREQKNALAANLPKFRFIKIPEL